VALAITGVLGPDPDEDGNPVGLVFCATARRNGASRVVKVADPGRDPDTILRATLTQGLSMLHDECSETRK